MAWLEQNTLWRERETRAIKSLITQIWHSVKVVLHPRKHPHVKDLNAHHARDIGVSPSDLARHQHRWPSQNSHHPRG